MAKYRKKPVVIEAVQWTGTDLSAVIAFCPSAICGRRDDRAVIIPTLEGEMLASVGDFIVRGVKGELYPCKPDIFEATYEAVAGNDAPASAMEGEVVEVITDLSAKKTHVIRVIKAPTEAT